MGCTSAKPKRTTSIEDLAAKQPQNANQVPDKNGQVSKAPSGDKEKILREKQSETNAVEIPGAHKSFMAPDGIPFIDEDVESEVDDVQLTGNQLANANDNHNVKLGSPDQNKNIAIVANKEAEKLLSANTTTAPEAAGTRPSALVESVPQGHLEHPKQITTTSEPAAVISEIKTQEIQITTTKHQLNETNTEVVSRTVVTDKGKTDEEIAATKIQAGIRGYLDRQKVKAIRANRPHPLDANVKPIGDTQQNPGPELVQEHVAEEHDPKLDAAATKIQANYKGYRIRKEIKTAQSK